MSLSKNSSIKSSILLEDLDIIISFISSNNDPLIKPSSIVSLLSKTSASS